MPWLEAQRDTIHSARILSGAVTAAAGKKCVALMSNIAKDAATPGNYEMHLIEAGMYWVGTSGPIKMGLCRTSTAGTASTQVQPDLDNSWEGEEPKLSTLLHTDFTAQPTFLLPEIHGHTGGTPAGAAGTGYVWTFPRGFRIPDNQGVAIYMDDATNALATGAEFYWIWEERSL